MWQQVQQEQPDSNSKSLCNLTGGVRAIISSSWGLMMVLERELFKISHGCSTGLVFGDFEGPCE